MRSASRWLRLIAAMAVAVVWLSACEDEDKVVSPIKDITPPSVTISSINSTPESLTVTIRADDYISVSFVISEICCDTGGNVVASDTTATTGRTTSATVRTEYGFATITQPVNVTITGIGVDSSGNRAERSTTYTITP